MIDLSTNLANTSSNKPHNYHEQSQIDQTLRLREVLKTLPPFEGLFPCYGTEIIGTYPY